MMKSNEYLSSSEYNSSNLNVSYLLLKYDNNLFKISILNLFSLINQSDNNFDSDNLANLIDSDEPYTLQITDGDNNNYNITVKDFLSSLYETPSVTNITLKIILLQKIIELLYMKVMK